MAPLMCLLAKGPEDNSISQYRPVLHSRLEIVEKLLVEASKDTPRETSQKLMDESAMLKELLNFSENPEEQNSF